MAQYLQRPWLDRDPESYCFVPAKAVAWQRDRSRRRPVAHISNVTARSSALRRAPGRRYTRLGYRVAIQRACRRASPPGRPTSSRHTRATLVRQRNGLEAVKAVLGHTDTKITEIHAERDVATASRIMREIG